MCMGRDMDPFCVFTCGSSVFPIQFILLYFGEGCRGWCWGLYLAVLRGCFWLCACWESLLEGDQGTTHCWRLNQVICIHGPNPCTLYLFLSTAYWRDLTCFASHIPSFAVDWLSLYLKSGLWVLSIIPLIWELFSFPLEYAQYAAMLMPE